MTALTDLHAEELLLERELQGDALGGRERQVLDEHVRSCDTCRLVRLAAADFAREVPADAPPPPHLERLIQTALWSMRAPEVRGAPQPKRAAIRPVAPRAVAAAVTICLGGFAAAHLAGVFHQRARSGPTGAGAVAVTEPSPPPGGWRRPEPPPARPEAPPTGPAASPRADPPRAAGSTARPGKPASSAGRPWEELFRRATVARAQGRTQQALQLYGELARDYPRSPEGTSALVFKARLELDRGNPAAAAADFDRYLVRDAGGALEEEALVGRAEALRMVGRPAQEAAAWTRLLNRFPGSAHAHRAKARLADLRSPP